MQQIVIFAINKIFVKTGKKYKDIDFSRHLSFLKDKESIEVLVKK